MNQKISIEYTKDADKLKIAWKVDSKRKQKVILEHYKDHEKHFNVLELVLQQFGWKLIIKPSVYTDCDFNRLTGYQDQQEIVELQLSCNKQAPDIVRTYKAKDFSIPLVLMDLKKLLDKEIDIKAEFN